MSAIKRWCETCEGCGHVDETLGGERFSDPKAECPDCDGKGYWIAHLTQPAQSVDAECLRELVTKWEARGAEERRYSGEYYSGRAQAYDACSEELADKLTAALQEKGNG